MAKYILWAFFILGFMGVILMITGEQEVSKFTSTTLLSILSVIAICEAIEKRHSK